MTDLGRLMRDGEAPDVDDVAAALRDPRCGKASRCSTAELFALLIAPAVAADMRVDASGRPESVTLLHNRAAQRCAVLDRVHPEVPAQTVRIVGFPYETRGPPDLTGDRCILGMLPFKGPEGAPEQAYFGAWTRDIVVWHIRPSAWAWIASNAPPASQRSPIDAFVSKMGRRIPSVHTREMEYLAAGHELCVPLDAFMCVYGHFVCRAEGCGAPCSCAPSRCRGPRGGGGCETRYCSLACQRADWGRHKAVCGIVGADRRMPMDCTRIANFVRKWDARVA